MLYRKSFVMLLVILASTRAASPTAKSVTRAVPKEVKKEIASQLSDKAVELLDDNKKLIAEIWVRKLLPVKATEAEIKKGLSYRAIKQTTLIGLIRIHQSTLGDYRGQKPKKGLYTMRLGFQPMDGDHMGTAPFASFVLLTPAGGDSGKATVDYDDLQDESTKASGTGHPCIWLLFPLENKELKDAPQVSKKFGKHQVLSLPCDVSVGGKKMGVMGIGLTVVGKSDAA